MRTVFTVVFGHYNYWRTLASSTICRHPPDNLRLLSTIFLLSSFGKSSSTFCIHETLSIPFSLCSLSLPFLSMFFAKPVQSFSIDVFTSVSDDRLLIYICLGDSFNFRYFQNFVFPHLRDYFHFFGEIISHFFHCYCSSISNLGRPYLYIPVLLQISLVRAKLQ